MKKRLADLRFRLGWELRAARAHANQGLGLWVGRHVPRWVRYWVTLCAIATATTGEYSGTVVPELPAMEVLERI